MVCFGQKIVMFINWSIGLYNLDSLKLALKNKIVAWSKVFNIFRVYVQTKFSSPRFMWGGGRVHTLINYWQLLMDQLQAPYLDANINRHHVTITLSASFERFELEVNLVCYFGGYPNEHNAEGLLRCVKCVEASFNNLHLWLGVYISLALRL
jgi:hypothetical protein